MPERATQTVVVTGATAGIGFVTARSLASDGMRVVALGRSPARITAADAAIRASIGEPNLEWIRADFASLDEVARASEEIAASCGHIDVLVNNAGNQLIDRRVTADGFETTYQVNHLAPFLMTAKLLPNLLRSDRPQVITLSSIGHSMIDDMVWDDLQMESDFSAFRAYAQSKLANVLFTHELARRTVGTALVASAVHPGLVASDFPNKGDTFMQDYYRDASARGEALTSEQGAETVVWLARGVGNSTPSGGYFFRRERVAASAGGSDPVSARRLWAISEAQVSKFL